MTPIDKALQDATRYLFPQGPLKEFVAQNPLKGFMDFEFHDAMRRSSSTYGAWSYFPLHFYRQAFASKQISESALQRSLEWNIDDPDARHRARADLFEYPDVGTSRPASIVQTGLRVQWEKHTHINVIDHTNPMMFRLLAAYLDQGISVWRMPTGRQPGFLNAIRSLAADGRIPTLNQELLAMDVDLLLNQALTRLLGEESLFERYIYDVIFSHPGWSSTVNFLEKNPGTLVLHKDVTIKDVVAVALLFDLGFLETKWRRPFMPLSHFPIVKNPLPMVVNEPATRTDFIKAVWHEAWEWGFYEQSLNLIASLRQSPSPPTMPSIQLLFCLDDRECSVRRYLENRDNTIHTYGLPGYFGIDFMYQCADHLFPTRHAPIVVKPKHVIRTTFTDQHVPSKNVHRLTVMDPATHTMFRGWLITQVLGLSAAVKLALAIFRPSMNQATASSLSRVNEHIDLNIERKVGAPLTADGFLPGFTVDEMADKIQRQLEAIGLTKGFAPLVALIAHGSSSTNNTHFSAYDCGACCGKPGTPNARVFAAMANRKDVRAKLATRGIEIPCDTVFCGALHDTTRDEVKFYDLGALPAEAKSQIDELKRKFDAVLELNAKERCRRFDLVRSNISGPDAIKEVRRRSAAIFEPIPELTHTGNAMVVVGRRHLTAGGFFDRRSFLHSYDPSIDPTGEILKRVLGAVIPVCGGINLCYYFSKLDNDIYGAGSKLPHNIISLIGVANGVEGDIRCGLPRQMIELHDPIRLQLVIEQSPEILQMLLATEPNLGLWIKNSWMRLVSISPENGEMKVWKKERFVAIQTKGRSKTQ